MKKRCCQTFLLRRRRLTRLGHATQFKPRKHPLRYQNKIGTDPIRNIHKYWHISVSAEMRNGGKEFKASKKFWVKFLRMHTARNVHQVGICRVVSVVARSIFFFSRNGSQMYLSAEYKNTKYLKWRKRDAHKKIKIHMRLNHNEKWNASVKSWGWSVSYRGSTNDSSPAHLLWTSVSHEKQPRAVEWWEWALSFLFLKTYFTGIISGIVILTNNEPHNAEKRPRGIRQTNIKAEQSCEMIISQRVSVPGTLAAEAFYFFYCLK